MYVTVGIAVRDSAGVMSTRHYPGATYDEAYRLATDSVLTDETALWVRVLDLDELNMSPSDARSIR